MQALLAAIACIYASIILLSIVLTALDLHIGFTNFYLTFVAATFDYGKERIIAKVQSSCKLAYEAASKHFYAEDSVGCVDEARSEQVNVDDDNSESSLYFDEDDDDDDEDEDEGSECFVYQDVNGDANKEDCDSLLATSEAKQNNEDNGEIVDRLAKTLSGITSGSLDSDNEDALVMRRRGRVRHQSTNESQMHRCKEETNNNNSKTNNAYELVSFKPSSKQKNNTNSPNSFLSHSKSAAQLSSFVASCESLLDNDLSRPPNADVNGSTEKNSKTLPKSHSTYFPNSPEEPPVLLLNDSDFESETPKQEFDLDDPCYLIARAIDAIIDDQVLKRFNSKPLRSWNLLTRTNSRNYQFLSFRVGVIWLLGCFIRYIILMPIRILLTLVGVSWLVLCAPIIGCLPEPIKSKFYRIICLMSFRMISRGFTAVPKFHNAQYRPQKGDICVANHTSPIDVLLLGSDNCYALVGQRHKGILGLLERILSQAAKHVWFDRSELKDRALVLERLKEHVRGTSKTVHFPRNNSHSPTIGEDVTKNLPILVFPEGTCINNSAVMMFKKGSFEASERVCPIAMRYDFRFGDPFWNSSKQGYFFYLLMLMSSWAIVCDVWYLEPMVRIQGESSTEFANRVKHAIATQSGLVELAWDGQLKRSRVKVEWKQKQQEVFAKRFKIDD